MDDEALTDSSVEVPIPQGDLRLLREPQAQRLLASRIPCRFAFTWRDGTPRVIPTWFHWTGEEVVMVTYLAGPHIGIRHAARRVEVLRERPDVALTIDTESFPPETLLLRGRVTITDVDGIASEYRSAARRYMGDEAAEEMLTTVDQPGTRQATIRLRPTWAGLIDFGARRPSAQGGIG